MKSNSIWMLVTRDKYELPVLVCDTAEELAEKLGCTVNSIYSSVSHARHRGHTSAYKKVEVDYEDSDRDDRRHQREDV